MLADLDDKVRSGDLARIFEKPSQDVAPAVPRINRFFRSVSVHTHRDANGVNFLCILKYYAIAHCILKTIVHFMLS